MDGRTKEKTGGNDPPREAVEKIHRPENGGGKGKIEIQRAPAWRTFALLERNWFDAEGEQGFYKALQELLACR